jgi:hypothetical protein
LFEDVIHIHRCLSLTDIRDDKGLWKNLDWILLASCLGTLLLETLYYVTLHNITLHSLDSELFKMTVGCGLCHINTKTYVQYNLSFRIRKPKKTQWWHVRLFKNTSIYIYIYIYISILSTYAIYTAFKLMSLFRQ